MKNRGSVFLIVLCVSFAAFTGGFFTGRNYNRSGVQLSVIRPSAGSTTASDTAASAVTTPSAQPVTTATQSKIDINTATAEQLQTLPGIGPVLAQRILAYREANGPFSSIEHLTLVEGIGEKRLAAIADYITAGG